MIMINKEGWWGTERSGRKLQQNFTSENIERLKHDSCLTTRGFLLIYFVTVAFQYYRIKIPTVQTSLSPFFPPPLPFTTIVHCCTFTNLDWYPPILG